MVFPRESTTVAVTVFPAPAVTLMVLLPLPVTASVIDSTGQVVKSRVWLLTLLRLAKIAVTPGFVRRYLQLSGTSPLTGSASVAVLRVATPEVIACQVKGPTLAVMSSPWLKALA